MEVTYQNKIATDGSTKILCTTESLVINSINITNLVSNFVITVNRYETGPGIHLIPLYQYELDQGDVLKDNDSISLSKGDYLQLISDVPETTYYIRATQ
jgi:hypothetical protein